MITMRKSIHGFPFLPYMGMGLRRSSAMISALQEALVQLIETGKWKKKKIKIAYNNTVVIWIRIE